MARLRQTDASTASLSPTQATRAEAPTSSARETRNTPRKDTPKKATHQKPTTKSSRKNTTQKIERDKPATPKATPKATQTAEVNGDVEAPKSSIVPATQEADGEDGEMEIESFKKHRVNKELATVDFLVSWSSGEATWEPESDLQEQVPNLVFEYWDAAGSRDLATGLDTYHVFKILKRTIPSSGKQPQYQIQWVGYKRKESSWEPEEKVKEIAPEELKAYEEKHGVATTSVAQKRPGGRGPGRPRKKAKTAVNGDE